VTLLYIIILLFGNPLVMAQLIRNMQKVWAIAKDFPNCVINLSLTITDTITFQNIDHSPLDLPV
jgi:hypothetical protein